MHVIILGSAAGGGYPQWNCHCTMCSGLRNGKIVAEPRTQSSIAVSDDGEHWVIINASPDIRQQINQNPDIHDCTGKRGSSIAAVVLTDAQVDHTSGLLILREGLPMDLYCTEQVRSELTDSFPLLNVLSHWHGGYQQHTINEQSWHIPTVPHLRFEAINLESKAPPYSSHRNDPHPGDNIAIRVTDTRTRRNLVYAPGLEKPSSHIEMAMSNADCILVDGTLWTDDEMILEGVGSDLGTSMGHLPISGKHGMLALLSQFLKPRKILVHINNTNPIIDERGFERLQVVRSGVEVGFDGMKFEV
ncbi:pyrroloquinoline quinone biosynthesis protein PqqB [Vibrio penaeicida]|uniref:Coenzyme PQQ synthesis protein B n=1 Tax=Vibrio penaeicida TaxID=104609 RepID=A0AAV5NTH6_9VIBR|nr:pyrroloquinoline quinone biosynthesis protein PqqB [Vibrio penaeicida]RTZ20446.1 pyrroloquinoline quinone biosynthesis protein PqqB [Vibrio penaeicida]GLQ73609.1 coenzyme PQQ synthesis protein B [Vibrio penaeicida]